MAKKKAKAVKRKKAPAKKKMTKRPAKKSAKKVAPKKKVKKRAKKASLKVQPLKAGYQPAANEVSLGEVEDYFSHIGVIALTLKSALSIGNTIHVHGHTTDLTQTVDSMQIDHALIQDAKKGDSVGIKANDKCRKGDQVFRVG